MSRAGGVAAAVALCCVGEVTVDEDTDCAADGELDTAVEDGDEPTPRRRQAAQEQLLRQDGHRQLIRSSADMWLMTWWYERRRQASPAQQHIQVEPVSQQLSVSLSGHNPPEVRGAVLHVCWLRDSISSCISSSVRCCPP